MKDVEISYWRKKKERKETPNAERISTPVVISSGSRPYGRARRTGEKKEKSEQDHPQRESSLPLIVLGILIRKKLRRKTGEGKTDGKNGIYHFYYCSNGWTFQAPLTFNFFLL